MDYTLSAMDVLIQSIASLLPLLLALLAGFLLGRLRPRLQECLLALGMRPVVWGILFLIGMASASAFTSLAAGLDILYQAVLYAGVISLLVFVFLLPFNPCLPATEKTRSGWRLLWLPLRECLGAFALILGGAVFQHLHADVRGMAGPLFDLSNWILGLLFLVGVELSAQSLSRDWLSLRTLLLPVLVLLASLLAGVLLGWMTGESLPVALALSSGFGWYSLSGALAGEYLGDRYASLAVLINLLREMLGLGIVLLAGRNCCASSIGVCGATALDTTLPFIRKGCGQQWLPAAIVSGLLLTVAAPVLMLLFLGWATA